MYIGRSYGASVLMFIIFHNRGKIVDMNGLNVVYDDKEPLGADPHLVVPLERYHSNHENPDCRAYKLGRISQL
jgi:hypothetical protein